MKPALAGCARVLFSSEQRYQAGFSAVEFALIAPAFLMLVMGIIEFGRVLHTYQTLDHATREGVRYAIVRGSESTTPATVPDIQNAVKGRAITLAPADLTVTVTYPDGNNDPGNTVTIQATYTHKFLMPFVPFEPINLTRASSMVIAR